MTQKEKDDFDKEQKGNKKLRLRKRRRAYYKENKEEIKVKKLNKEEMIDKELKDDMMTDKEFMDWVDKVTQMTKEEIDELIELEAGLNPHHINRLTDK
ncbi:hypothetical protein N9562_00305 [Flavobacteriaceae bacterium]|nr:hypothetical protein [Flavobacteriaceae bacterium]